MLSLSNDERNGKVRSISLETLLEDKHIMRYLGKWGLLRQNIFGQDAWAYLGRLNPSEPMYHHGREFDGLHDAGLNYRSPNLSADEKEKVRAAAIENIEHDESKPKQQLFQAFLANYMDNVDILNDMIRAKKGKGFPEDSRSLQYNEHIVENMLQFIWHHHNQDTPERQDGLLYVTHPVRVAYIGQVFTIFSYYPEIKDQERALLVKDFLLDTLTFLGHDLLETTRLGSQDEDRVVETFNATIFPPDFPPSETGVSHGKLLYDNLMSVSKIKSHSSGTDTWMYDLLRSYQRYFSGDNGSFDLRGRIAPIITRQADCADNVFTLSHKGIGLRESHSEEETLARLGRKLREWEPIAYLLMKSARLPRQLPAQYRTGRYSHHYTLFDLTYQTIKRYNKLLNPSYKLELSPSDIERECRLLAAQLPDVENQEVEAIVDREIPLRNFTTGEDEVTTLRGMLPVFSDLTKRCRRTYFQDNYVGALNILLVLTPAKEANLKLEKPEES